MLSATPITIPNSSSLPCSLSTSPIDTQIVYISILTYNTAELRLLRLQPVMWKNARTTTVNLTFYYCQPSAYT